MDDRLVYVLLDAEHMEVIGVYTDEAVCRRAQDDYCAGFAIWGDIQMRRIDNTLDLDMPDEEE